MSILASLARSFRPEVRLALAAELLAAVAGVCSGPGAEAIARAQVAVEEARRALVGATT